MMIRARGSTFQLLPQPPTAAAHPPTDLLPPAPGAAADEQLGQGVAAGVSRWLLAPREALENSAAPAAAAGSERDDGLH
jgi:hypothetical protein